MPSTNDTVTPLLVVLDVLGVLVLFNLGHWWVTGTFADGLLLNWKLTAIAALAFLSNYLLDTYTFESHLSRLGLDERTAIAMVLTGTGIALLVYIMGPGFIGGFVGRGVLATSLVAVWLWSLAIRMLLSRVLSERQLNEHWLVIDASPDHADAAIQLAAHFRRRVGDQHLALLTDARFDPPPAARIDRLGGLDDFDATVAAQLFAGIIVVAAERLDEALISRLLQTRIAGTRIYNLNDFYESRLGRLPVAQLSENWIATAQGFDLIHNPIGLRFKRYIDILVSLVAGVVLAPLAGLVALVVLATSGLPILFVQERTGENGRPFRMVKFRTMRRDAEADGARFATVGDPRTTPLGGILRKFRLDELPQLWNVLAGDMSLIGPRPERPVFIAELERRIPYYNLRHMVKPGITGWAQVMHGYGDSEQDAEEKLQYDLFYIKNYSLLLDIGIVLRSARVILFGTGR